MKRLTGMLGAFVLLGCAPLMQGALQISYQETSPAGPATLCGTGPDTGPVVCAASLPGVTINVLSASSNSPGTPALSQQFGSTLQITTTADVTLHVWFAAQDFLTPTTPPSILYSSSLSLTSTTGTGKVGLESCVDGSNGLAPPTTPFCSNPEASLTNTDLNYNGATSSSNTVQENVASLTTVPYSLSQELTLTLGAGSNLNVITSQILTPVPEPGTLALLGSGLLGVGMLFRRKVNAKRS